MASPVEEPPWEEIERIREEWRNDLPCSDPALANRILRGEFVRCIRCRGRLPSPAEFETAEDADVAPLKTVDGENHWMH